MAKREAYILLGVRDQATRTLRSIGREFPRLAMLASTAGGAASLAFKGMGMAATHTWRSLKSLGGMLRNYGKWAAVGVGGATALAVRRFMSFSNTMSEVRAVTGASNEDFGILNATAKRLGATTTFTAKEVADGMKYMGMAGYNTRQIYAGIPHVLDLARAGALDLGRASDIATDIGSAFGMSAGEIGHMADVLAVAATSANTNVGMIGETMQYAAAPAAAAGQSLEMMAAATGLVANNGIKGSMAGTDLARILKELAKTDVQEKLQALGVAVGDSTGRMRPLIDIMRDLGRATAGMTQVERLAFFDELFERAARSGLMLSSQTAEFENLYQKINHADGAAKKMAATMADNLGGAWEAMTGAVDGVAMAVGTELDAALQTSMNSAAQWANQNENEIARFAGIAAAYIEYAGGILGDFFGSGDSWSEKWLMAWTIFKDTMAAGIATMADMAVAGGQMIFRGLMSGFETSKALHGFGIDLPGIGRIGFKGAFEEIEERRERGELTDEQAKQARRYATEYTMAETQKRWGTEDLMGAAMARASDRFTKVGENATATMQAFTPDFAGRVEKRGVTLQQQLRAADTRYWQREDEQRRAEAGAPAGGAMQRAAGRAPIPMSRATGEVKEANAMAAVLQAHGRTPRSPFDKVGLAATDPQIPAPQVPRHPFDTGDDASGGGGGIVGRLVVELTPAAQRLVSTMLLSGREAAFARANP